MADYEKLKKQIDEKIASYHAEMIEFSDHIADNPEISGEEYETSKYIVEFLRGKGFDVEYPYGGLDTAFLATYGKTGRSHRVAILTEYDALPEIGHACGHNISGSMSVLAGLATIELQDELDCDIHIVGTPNEEMDGGKCRLDDRGLFDGYDMAMMVHLYDQNLLTCKLLALKGRMVEFHGKAAHAAMAPWEGTNALNAAELFMHAIDCYRQHVTPDVRIHGIYFNGGEAPNIVPEEASIKLYMRCLNKGILDNVIDRDILNMAQGACLMTGCTLTADMVEHPYDDLKPNPTGLEAIREIYDELGIDLNGDHSKIFGSSDIGNVSYSCPAFHPTLQLVDRGVAIHTREFEAQVKSERAHELIATGAKVIAYQIAKVIGDEERNRRMQADFKE